MTDTAPMSAAGDNSRRLNLIPAADRTGPAGKIIGVTNAGRRVHVGISLDDLRHHAHVLGPTGTGKTALLLNMIRADVTAGRGVAAFDPAKGDLIRDLLAVLPADCSDRLVIIDPDEKAAPPAINLLDPATHGGSPHDVAAALTSVMAKVWSRWWGHRTADICYHGLLTLAYLPGSTLAHLPRLLSDQQWRTSRVQTVTGHLNPWEANTLVEFWDGFDAIPAAGRAGVTAPLLSRLRLVLAHPLAHGLFGVPASTFRFADILDGGVLLCRLPKGVIGEDGTRLIGSLLLAGLWQATTARARIPENQRLDATCYLDECHNFLHLPIGIDDALAEARGLHTSFVLAHQYLDQLSAAMAAAIDANARNKVYFALAPGDAVHQARHLKPYLDDGDLIRLGGFEVILRPLAGGRTLPPVTADTLPPPKAVPGRATALRQAAREHTGLTQKTRQTLQGAAVINTPSPHGAAGITEETTDLPIGSNTFNAPVNVRGERSNDGSNEGPLAAWLGDEPSPEHTPLNSPSGLANDTVEDWWTGTD